MEIFWIPFGFKNLSTKNLIDPVSYLCLQVRIIFGVFLQENRDKVNRLRSGISRMKIFMRFLVNTTCKKPLASILSNIPTNLYMALYCILLCCFVLYCIDYCCSIVRWPCINMSEYWTTLWVSCVCKSSHQRMRESAVAWYKCRIKLLRREKLLVRLVKRLFFVFTYLHNPS